ncbi:MAG: CPBP family intramembrane metalloprotease [Bacteroidetes bacterium]|nr:CPBP family intramembrane metalloprotease [Bacteroidota bacterium]
MDSIKHPKYYILIAALVTLFGIGGLGLGLMYFFHKSLFYQLLIHPARSIAIQVAIGTIYAIIALIPLTILLQLKMLDGTRHFFADLLLRFKVSFPQIILLSLCAGIGEELLFRGAIQPWLGIWLTAALFIALHGYLNPKNKPLFIYGIVLLVVSAGFGYLLPKYGIYAAMSAHFWIDVVLMLYLKKAASKLKT